MKVKEYSELQVDAIIKLKFGSLVEDGNHKSYVSNAILGKLFKCSDSKIRQLYLKRFHDIAMKKMPLLIQMQNAKNDEGRKQWGIRFLKAHQIRWATQASTLYR